MLIRDLMGEWPSAVRAALLMHGSFADGTAVPYSDVEADAVATAEEPSSSYEAMKLLSQVMLLPALEERVLGDEVSKRHGIMTWLASPPRSVAMELASAARESWPASHVERTKGFYRLPVNPWVASSLRRRIVAVPREVVFLCRFRCDFRLSERGSSRA